MLRYPFCEKKILESARKIGKPITNSVITHVHDDHIGELITIKQDYQMLRSIFLKGMLVYLKVIKGLLVHVNATDD